MPSTKPSSPSGVIGVYCPVYLPETEGWFYQVISALTTVEVHVFYHRLANVGQFPYQNLHCASSASHTSGMKRFWRQVVLKEQAFVYEGHQDVLLTELQFWQIQLVHLYGGFQSSFIYPLLNHLEIPYIITFHTSDRAILTSLGQSEVPPEIRALLENAVSVGVTEEGMKDILISLGCPPDRLMWIQQTPEGATQPKLADASVSLRQFYETALYCMPSSVGSEVNIIVADPGSTPD